MSALACAPHPPRSPWQRLYATALARRAARLHAAAERLPRPVISVGNLHWGGGGKTPFTLALAARLRDGGRRVAILSRGYRRASRGPLLVSTGAGPMVAPAVAGDEPFLLASELPGVAVAVAGRRHDAGRLAWAELGGTIDLFVLDDGFSHATLARDLDLLLFPAADPWARGRLLPSGRLREPLAASARADAVVLTGGEPPLGDELARALAAFGFGGRGFTSATLCGAPARIDGAPLPAATRVLAVAAIARPESFFADAERSGLQVVARLRFRDHAEYSDGELRRLEHRAREARAQVVLTTAKDRTKLAGRLRLPLAVLPIEARPEPAFWRWLDARLAELAP